MTISTQNRVAGPFPGDGSTVVLPFTFKVFLPGELVVISTNPAGVDTTLALTTNYGVTLNADQNVSPGGTINMNLAQAVGYKTTVTTALAYLQTLQLQNGGAFNASVVNDALDRIVILIQQVLGATARSLTIPITDGTGVSTAIPNALARANKVMAFDSLGNIIVSNLTLAALEAVTNTASTAASQAAASAVLAQGYSTTAGSAATAAQTAQAAAEAAAAGMRWRPSVKAASTGALPSCTYANGSSGVGATLTATANAALASQDGVALAVNDRFLVKDQGASLQNGVYVVTQLGSAGTPWILTRAVDADSWAELVSQVVAIEQGTTQQDKIYICTVDQGGTIGTTAVSWASITSGFGSVTPFRLVAGTDFTAGSSTTLTIPTGGLLMLNFDGITQSSSDYSNNPTTGAVTLTSAVPLGVTQISGAVISVLAIGVPGTGTVTPNEVSSSLYATTPDAQGGVQATRFLTSLTGKILFDAFSKFTLFAAAATTSGTAIDITGIPANAKRITVMFLGVQKLGTSTLKVQGGTAVAGGTIETTGYNSSAVNINSSASPGAATNDTTSFIADRAMTASAPVNGQMILTLANAAANTWAESVNMNDATQVHYGAGMKSFAQAIDRIRLTSGNGTDVFNGGSYAIMVEV